MLGREGSGRGSNNRSLEESIAEDDDLVGGAGAASAADELMESSIADEVGFGGGRSPQHSASGRGLHASGSLADEVGEELLSASRGPAGSAGEVGDELDEEDEIGEASGLGGASGEGVLEASTVSSIEEDEDAAMAAQRELIATLRDALAGRRAQAQGLLEEAHVSERTERRRLALLQEERELVAQLEAMEGLIRQGRQRLRAAEASASVAVTHSGSVAEVLSGSGGSGQYGDGSFEADDPSIEEEDEAAYGASGGRASGARLGASGSGVRSSASLASASGVVEEAGMGVGAESEVSEVMEEDEGLAAQMTDDGTPPPLIAAVKSEAPCSITRSLHASLPQTTCLRPCNIGGIGA